MGILVMGGRKAVNRIKGASLKALYHSMYNQNTIDSLVAIQI